MLKGHIRQDWYDNCLEYHQKDYPIWWKRMFDALDSKERGDHFSLISSSSYLVSLGEMKILIDPAWYIPGVFDSMKEQMKKDLAKVDYIIFTHEHGDHFNPEQIAFFKDLPVKWIVPIYFDKWFLSTGVDPKNIIFASPDMIIDLGGGKLHALEGNHNYPDGEKGPKELMYIVEAVGKKIFFPADLRAFKPEMIPDEGEYDCVFLHMYLSRTDGYSYPFDEYYPDLVKYAAALNTKKVFIGHLYGFQCGSPDRIWNYMHAGMLMDGLFCLRPDMELIIPFVGKSYDI
ncbi:MAG: MBL fold metallo-hydrolase [Clostridia bacterium]|nr:MBL fold metallo-hydrolase [Clostridia bacterium]